MKNKFKINALALLALSTLNYQLSTAFAQGTAFTYQGRLNNNGNPAAGTYNLTFTLFNTNASGVAIAGPVTNSAVSVTNGLFMVQVDFGPGVFIDTTNWLQIGVATNGVTSFTALAPRQQLTPTPYAIYAESAGGIAGLVVQSDTNGAPNLIGGSSLNFVASGIVGATIGGGGATNVMGAVNSNSVTGNFGTVGGGAGNSASFNAAVGGGFGNNAGAAEATVGGGAFNSAGVYATEGGGFGNNASGGGSFVGGGGFDGINKYFGNRAQGGASVVVGGLNNIAANQYSVIVGGYSNSVSGIGAFIGGGGYDGTSYQGSAAAGNASFIGGGLNNNINVGADDAVIAGGDNNAANSPASVISGGEQNTTGEDHTSIAGGQGNYAGGSYASVGGGQNNNAGGAGDVLAGGYNNSSGGGNNSAISGGNNNNSSGSDAVIGGGQGNQVSAWFTAIGGGVNNTATNDAAVVAGGTNNVSGGFAASVGGGSDNAALGNWSTVGGGWLNQANGDSATVGGGYGNSAVDSATVAGGRDNVASDYVTTVAGGLENQSLVYGSTVGGGLNNTASGYAATIPGGASNVVSGSYSFAAGFQAQATNNNSFVWNDGSASTVSTTNNQFVARAANGFVLFSSAGGTGVSLAPGSGSWSSMSDRNAKDGFAPVNALAVLAQVAALPMTTWSYKTEPGVRHVGPMAQDFHAAFAVGEDDRHIADVDEGGVALAAIQGLNQELEARSSRLETENAELKQENESLAKRLAALEQIVLKQKPN